MLGPLRLPHKTLVYHAAAFPKITALTMRQILAVALSAYCDLQQMKYIASFSTKTSNWISSAQLGLPVGSYNVHI